ncbi:MAG: MIP/aquaporin family protein, partial [Bacteroidota bacterium]
MSPFLAEILGTMTLMLFGSGVNANVTLKGTYGRNSGWIVITAGWGLAVFAGVVVAGPVSGAHLNPAVSLGLAAAGKFDWPQVAPYILAQLIGASMGTFLVWFMYKDHFDQEEEPGKKLGVFSTG